MKLKMILQNVKGVNNTEQRLVVKNMLRNGRRTWFVFKKPMVRNFHGTHPHVRGREYTPKVPNNFPIMLRLCRAAAEGKIKRFLVCCFVQNEAEDDSTEC